MVAPTHWGVDSVTPSTFVKSKKTAKTLWQLTVDRFGRQPEFWGRYLNAGNDALTSAEVTFLHASNCRIVPVFLIDPKNIKSEAVGKSNAQSAINMAKALSMPNSVFIYADLEWDYQPSADWMRGWWSTMKLWMGVGCGGFYCTPVANNFNFPVPYCKAVKTAEPRTFRRLWANSPAGGMGLVPKGPLSLSTIDFKPDQPPCENVSAIWQYFLNRGDKIPADELPDLDLAIDEGWDVMWKPPQKTPNAAAQAAGEPGAGM